MNTQIAYDTEAYIITDTIANEAWLLAWARLCNGTYIIIKGNHTRVYQTERRFKQAFRAMMDEAQAHGWSKTLA